MAPLPPLPDPLRDRPFTTREALALDVPPDVLRTRRVRSPFRGVHVPAVLPDTLETRCAALALLLPHAVFSHQTAAELQGLPLPERVRRPGSVHVTVPAGAVVPRIRGVVGHESVNLRWRTTVGARHVPVVQPSRTWCDLVPALPDVDAIVLGDAVLRVVGREHLGKVVDGRAGERGVVRMRRLLEHLRECVDSPMETRTRLVLVGAGLPEPACGREVVAGTGWIATPDLSWPDYKVAVEYDGEHHRTDRRQWRNDIARKQGLEDEGWRVIVLTADDVLRRPHETALRVRRALEQRGWRSPRP